MAFIECENLYRIYKTSRLEVVALQGIDLTVVHGEMLAIIGASGSGKTTLLNILGGMDIPSAGTIRVGDYDLTRITESGRVEYRRNVGILRQQTRRNLLPYLTALQNVELPMSLAGIDTTERNKRARNLLAQVGLEDRMNNRPSQLSSGQQQRVAVAAAMANRPALLLADEPTGQLDKASSQQLFAAFAQMNATYGVTLIVVTHDPYVAEHSQRVISMRDGRITEEIRRQSGIEQVFSVLDKGGRVQVPQNLVEAHKLHERVTIKNENDHIAIYPAEMDDTACPPS